MKELYDFCVKYQKWLDTDKDKKTEKLPECEIDKTCDKCNNKIGQWVEED